MKKKRVAIKKWSDEEKEVGIRLGKKYTKNGRLDVVAMDADPERAKIKRKSSDIKQWLWVRNLKMKTHANGVALTLSPSPSRRGKVSDGQKAYEVFCQTRGFAMDWANVPADEQVAWQMAVEAVRPKEKWVPSLCPECGFNLGVIMMAMNMSQAHEQAG